MDTSALRLIIEMLSRPVLIDFFSENVPGENETLFITVFSLTTLLVFMKSTRFRGLPQEKRQAQIEIVRLTAHKVGNFMSEIIFRRKAGSSRNDDLVKDWKEINRLINDMIDPVEKIPIYEWEHIERNEKMLLETADCSNCEALTAYASEVLLFKKAFPDAEHTDAECIPSHLLLLRKAHDPLFELLPNHIINLKMELGNLPQHICNACEKQPLALLLIGGLLSLKPKAYDIWNGVNDDLIKIKESNNSVTSNNICHIINYCYDDLPYSLQLCFLYFACYPIGYEIPATSLTHVWIAEGFITPGEGEWVDEEFATPEKEETREEIANKYLEQLVKRSLVYVSKRSLLGTIKSCRLPRPIHEFAIQQSNMDEFMVANPDQEKIESLFRLAILPDNKKQYTELKNNHIHSFLAFNFDRNILESAVLLRVLELRKSAIPVIALPNMISLRYLGLRGGNICELPKNIGDMEDLQTLDVRDTSIQTLPESLWTISKLRHVYVNPSPHIKGPPSAAIIPNLHILKTIAAHESWQENIPKFLKNLRKFALSNWDNLDCKSISNLLNHPDNLITLAIKGNIIPSECANIRAFPNLETVKSVKLEGQWKYCRKLSIDNYKFPPNLTKLTLTNSSLKEDPMPTLGRLQALKLLRLLDEAYTGNQMVCSANGFPQLQFFKLKKLENLVNWVVEPNAMSRLTTLRVVQCGKLNYPSNLTVTISDIDD